MTKEDEDNNYSTIKTSKKKSVIITLATVLMFVAVMAFAIYEGTKNTVTMISNGEKEEVKTHAETVGAFLAEQSIEVGQDDYLSHTAEASIDKDIVIEWTEADQFTITVDGKPTSAWTTSNTVEDILAKAEIEITEHDKVTPALNEEVDANTAISVEKAYEVTIFDGLEEKKVWSTSTTVADFLKQHKITLSDLDRVEKDMDELILPGSEVKVVRVEKVTDVVEDSVKFAKETKKDSSLLKGSEKVVQKGEEGLVEKTYEVVMENGKEVKRELKGEKVIKEAKKQVVAVGTKTVVASVSRGNDTTAAAPAPKKAAAPQPAATSTKTTKTAAPVQSSEPSSSREFYVSATAYTASCTGCSGITATGINLKANPHLKVIAVDPSVIPLGSKVWVEGYGHAIAGDTGGAIKGNKIDIFMADRSAALAFGRQQVKIKILD
ncbi:G5 and 3D domain-containing protein [Planomicrobium sp. MB-3u-38]|uniref:G5 and 3D domain-containing protein n=1 Tax=Planomicrobium sp. MB-3u-38 TaxID=2058318 RepID=UPI001E601838|nr:G5 and 3D domain-containing protein [Planomicrobium sp. MB-3u-38]